VPRDMIEEAFSRTTRLWWRAKAVRRMLWSVPERLGLSAKLLLLTLLFVMLAEVLIFVPSVANYRISWLSDRLTAARLAALATKDRGEGTVPDVLRMELLRTASCPPTGRSRSAPPMISRRGPEGSGTTWLCAPG
jgi:hypothetical protein